jgi:hypothetical protein
VLVVVVVSKCRSFAFSKRTETLAALQSTQFNTARVVGAPVPGLKYKKLKLVHTRDSALKRPCVYSVVGTSFCLVDD